MTDFMNCYILRNKRKHGQNSHKQPVSYNLKLNCDQTILKNGIIKHATFSICTSLLANKSSLLLFISQVYIIQAASMLMPWACRTRTSESGSVVKSQKIYQPKETAEAYCSCFSKTFFSSMIVTNDYVYNECLLGIVDWAWFLRNVTDCLTSACVTRQPSQIEKPFPGAFVASLLASEDPGHEASISALKSNILLRLRFLEHHRTSHRSLKKWVIRLIVSPWQHFRVPENCYRLNMLSMRWPTVEPVWGFVRPMVW